MRVSFFFVLLALALPVVAGEAKKPVASQPALSGEAILKTLRPGHPRLLMSNDGFDALKKRVETDPVLREWDKTLCREADKVLTAGLPKHELPDGKRLLSTSRSVLRRTYTLAVMYRLHGDRKYVERLWKDLEAVAAFPDFNPKHFLDTAEMTHALAIAYDWLYDAWTEPQRATLRKAIVELGLKPGLAVYRSKGGWPKAIHNWNQVCNGGMTMGALALADVEPALAGEILQHAIASVPLAMRSYGPDGAWGEGPGYWAYATSYNVTMLAGLESALGTDFNLSKTPGFSQTGLFPLYITGPLGRTFNFEDSGDRIDGGDVMLWLANRFDQPAATWFAAQGKPSAQSLLWYRTPGKDPEAAGLPLDKRWRGVEAVTLRSRWNDPNALFVGFQAGSNRVNHNHLDCGSFVLDGLGKRWALDLGGDDYNLPGYFGKQRYSYYRLRAEGHNTLVLNPGQGPDQDERAETRIVRFSSDAESGRAVADLSPAYSAHAQKVLRGMAMLDRRAVLVQDEVTAAKPADLWWFMHTEAKIAIAADGRSAVLERETAKLHVRILAPAKARFEVRPAAPLPTSPDPERQARNDKARKLTIHMAGVTDLRLAVLFAPGDDEPVPVLQPLEQWQ